MSSTYTKGKLRTFTEVVSALTTQELMRHMEYLRTSVQPHMKTGTITAGVIAYGTYAKELKNREKAQ